MSAPSSSDFFPAPGRDVHAKARVCPQRRASLGYAHADAVAIDEHVTTSRAARALACGVVLELGITHAAAYTRVHFAVLALAGC